MINPLSNESSEHNGSYNNYSNKNNEQMILTFSDGRQISYDTYQLREISPKFVAKHMGLFQNLFHGLDIIHDLPMILRITLPTVHFILTKKRPLD